MTTPRRVRISTQPIGINDVLAYHDAAIDLKVDGNLVVNIGMEAMSFKDMLQQTALSLGLHRTILPVPRCSVPTSVLLLAAPGTPIPYRIGAALVEGLKSEPLMDNDHAGQYFPHIHPTSFTEAVRQAAYELEHDQVISRWCDASATASCDISEQERRSPLFFHDIRSMSTAGIPRDKLFASLCALGGDNGWLSYNGLWWLRGLIDKMLGGCGRNRGRRHPRELRIGDALDFWTVANLVPGKRLLQAQMKLPGKTWLEFDMQENILVQIAHFLPHGLWGRLYWYTVLPFHSFVFPSLCGKIIERAASLP